MKPEQKKVMLIVGIVLVILLLLGGYLISGRKSTPPEEEPETQLPTEAVIPTVDDSVIVDLKPANRKGEIIVTIENAPAGTKIVAFELSYNAQDPQEGGTTLQGAIGDCDLSDSIWECGEPTSIGRKIVLGTCSSGVCKYHNVVGKIRLNLKFTGNYGEKVFEGEYEI